MHKLLFVLFCYISIFSLFINNAVASLIPAVFINELHYDNTGADSNEFIELAGTEGVNLQDWTLQLYNGSNGNRYAQLSLSGIFNNQSEHVGFLAFSSVLQNGRSDAIALIDNHQLVVQFLSYEGVITALNGDAVGATSIDIGVTESSSTPVGYSLQLAGRGYRYQDFTWQSAQLATVGKMNAQQQFLASNNPTVKVTEPNDIGLWLILIMLSPIYLSNQKLINHCRARI